MAPFRLRKRFLTIFDSKISLRLCPMLSGSYVLVYKNLDSKMSFLVPGNSFTWFFISKMAVKMNLTITTKNHAAHPEKGFLSESISKSNGCATAMPTAWELWNFFLRFVLHPHFFAEHASCRLILLILRLALAKAVLKSSNLNYLEAYCDFSITMFIPITYSINIEMIIYCKYISIYFCSKIRSIKLLLIQGKNWLNRCDFLFLITWHIRLCFS